MSSPLVAIVDDEFSNAWALSLVLEDWGYRTVTGTDAANVLEELARLGEQPHILITDYHLVSSDGIDVTKAFRSKFGDDLGAVIITGTGKIDNIAARAPQDVPVMVKPVDPDALKEYLKSQIDRERGE